VWSIRKRYAIKDRRNAGKCRRRCEMDDGKTELFNENKVDDMNNMDGEWPYSERTRK
jgi:hypothetical protein